MSKNVQLFDHWLRTSFVEMNTELEETIFRAGKPAGPYSGVGNHIKENLVEEGNSHIIPLLKEGNTDEGIRQAVQPARLCRLLHGRVPPA